jgi:hypothetical protein
MCKKVVEITPKSTHTDINKLIHELQPTSVIWIDMERNIPDHAFDMFYDFCRQMCFNVVKSERTQPHNAHIGTIMQGQTYSDTKSDRHFIASQTNHGDRTILVCGRNQNRPKLEK